LLDTVGFARDHGAVILCGREFSAELIARLTKAGARMSRRALSRQLCQWLDWKGPSGRWQTTNARIALKRLERSGALELPAASNPFCKKGRRSQASQGAKGLAPIRGTLAQIGPVELVLVGSRHSQASRECRQLLQHYHPLGAQLCGAQLRYLIRCAQGTLGVLCFSAAARRLRARDQWIGWQDSVRAENLHLIVNNSRFLIRPGVEVKMLASHVLARAASQLPEHWQERYGFRPLLLETFVEKAKYRASSYRAANWIELDDPTSGRGRNDHEHSAQKVPKRILVYPLVKQTRERLRALPSQPRLAQQPRPIRPQAEPIDWAEEELGRAQLGDERLRKRLLVLARDFYARPQGNVPQSCGGHPARTKAAYRFFDHPNVEMDTVLQSHYQATAQRVAKEAVVLAAQDTTYLNYNAHPATENLGPIGSTAQGLIGLVVHDTMAFNLEGTPLGLLDVQCWARDPEQFGKKHRRRKLSFEEKESVKWLRSLEALERVQNQCPQTQLVSVGDREADIYELFVWVKQQPGRPQLLVRAEHNRRVQAEYGYLWETLASRPVAGIRSVRLPRRSNRPARQADLEVRFAPVELRAPKTRAKQPNVRLWAVWALEAQGPAGVEPVEWMLLTSLPVESLEQANQKLDWYGGRWGIEVFHRTLKSGCQIENRQLGSADRIEACLAIDLVVAWRIFHLTKLGREIPQAPCTVYFEPIQWQALVGFIHKDPIPPPQPPSLREALRMTASLGGFLGRKGDGEPGTQTIWLGLQRLDDIVESWKVFSAMFKHTVSSNRTYG
jgi:Druantia protein DruA/Transposase Tn5 dimerisation domain/Transposase DNA-binding